MNDRETFAWLHRRAGFGIHPAALQAIADAGSADPVADHVGPGPDGDAPLSDPWDGLALDPERDGRREAVVGWLRHLVATERPYEDRRTWLLHGWLVSSLGKVLLPELMVDQIRLLAAQGGGSYPDLLRAITIDRAMLVYLDGRTSTGSAPNENYGRELLELFALGVGNYTEADVLAAARALTGWVVAPALARARFVPRRHDDSPQRLLGVDGVHDVDTVIDAVVGHPAHATFVARRLVAEFLGDPDDESLAGVASELADGYVDADMHLDPVIATALRMGLDGRARPLVLAPIPWFVGALRVTGAPPERVIARARDHVREIGQLPMLPPDVAGWPTGEAWFTASSLIARTNVAAAIAEHTADDEPLRIAVDQSDWDLAAQHLGVSEPFGASTRAALAATAGTTNRLTLALVSPENLLT
ncbi:MAG: DUF1800 family protein [Ilumatobacter sp.]|uniref:DUF1800 family protein n=1 Tax=Ilumatobacter sp. TaxID=1967498 RepID=UPI0026218335|nr:DUF1800 family protein [Ilumatobacter sp.]MDJ0770550.1 DUF1800 family protein [Ilumatobacter sp.]